MAFISNTDDKLLFSRVDDIIELSLIRHKPCFFGFLNERDSYIIKSSYSYCLDNLIFYGGYSGAQRVMLCYCENLIDTVDFPIRAIYFKYRISDNLSHRDFLGAIMALGIERNCVGDIIVNNGYAVCYVKSDIYDFVISQLSKVGRCGIKVIDEKSCKVNYDRNFEQLSLTVSSMRLDVIVASLTGLSREKTRELILAQKVFTNYNVNQNVSHKLNANDILTIRGKGKYIIVDTQGVTKKGRLKILIEHFR